jgi:hypothetical protein
MGDHVAKPHWYNRIEGREVAMVRGAITAIVAIALIWGVDLTEWGDKVTATADILGTLVFTVLGPLWIRSGVTPAAEVVVQELPDHTRTLGAAATAGDDLAI